MGGDGARDKDWLRAQEHHVSYRHNFLVSSYKSHLHCIFNILIYVKLLENCATCYLIISITPKLKLKML